MRKEEALAGRQQAQLRRHTAHGRTTLRLAAAPLRDLPGPRRGADEARAATNGPPTLHLVEELEARVRPGEPRKLRRRDRGSRLARQRSAFTRGLSVVAAALIPRRARVRARRPFHMVQARGPASARGARDAGGFSGSWPIC